MDDCFDVHFDVMSGADSQSLRRGAELGSPVVFDHGAIYPFVNWSLVCHVLDFRCKLLSLKLRADNHKSRSLSAGLQTFSNTI